MVYIKKFFIVVSSFGGKVMRRLMVDYILFAILSIVLLFSCSGSKKNVEGLPVGSACKSSADCADKLVCIYADDSNEGVVNLFPGGYCSRYCLNDRDCPESSKCVGSVCIADCSNCSNREGYICDEERNYCIPDLKIGEQCTQDNDCLTKRCLVYSDRFKNGYCSMTCENGSDCPLSAGGLCVNFEGKEESTKTCAQVCRYDSDCRTSDKYACRLVFADSAESGGIFTTVCSGVDNLGAICQKDADCSVGLSCISKSDLVKKRSVSGGDFSESICSKVCNEDKDCPHISDCKSDDQDCLKTARCIDGYCFRGCESDEHCARSKYACRRYDYKVGQNTEYKYFCNSVSSIGTACSKDEECTAGLTCVVNSPEYANGFCTKSCTKDEDCPIEVGTVRMCIDGKCQRSCNTDEDCGRTGYLCVENNGKSFCKSKKNYGAACNSDSDCSEGLSCYKGYAFPDGYCTKAGTTSDQCEDGGVPGNMGLCMRQCSADSDCKRDGYFCFDSGSAKYCSTGFNVGFPCSEHPDEKIVDCGEGLRCAKDNEYEYGYCTMDCEKADDLCPDGSKCITTKKMCMRECITDDHCLISDYTCRKEDNVYVCVGGKNIGAACSQDSDCTADLTCDTKQNGGYCSMSCSNSDCPDNSVCVGDVCKRICKLDKDCGRRKYFCLTSKGVSYCVGTKNFGAECENNDDCLSPLVCYKPDVNKMGFCSNDNSQLCSSDTDCGESYAICNKDGDRHCYRRCSSDSECGREDMKCDSSMCVYK